MRLIALDCGLKTGFATYNDGHIESGVVELKQRSDESPGMRFHRFWKLLGELSDGGVDIIYYEKPQGLKGAAQQQHAGYVTRVEEYCSLHNIDYRPISPKTVKKHVVGRGNASKQDMCDWFESEFKRKPITDDEADATAVLIFGLNEIGIK